MSGDRAGAPPPALVQTALKKVAYSSRARRTVEWGSWKSMQVPRIRPILIYNPSFALGHPCGAKFSSRTCQSTAPRGRASLESRSSCIREGGGAASLAQVFWATSSSKQQPNFKNTTFTQKHKTGAGTPQVLHSVIPLVKPSSLHLPVLAWP